MNRISSRVAFVMLAFAVAFSSCTEEENVEPKDQATYDGVTYSFTQAFQEDLGGNNQNIRFASEDIAWDQESYSYSGTGDYLQLSFVLGGGESTFSDGTYTFSFDKEDNSIGHIQLRSDATDLTIDANNETTGSATIVITDDIYEVKGTFMVAGKELELYYKGTLTHADFPKNQATYDGVTYSFTQAFQEFHGGPDKRIKFVSDGITWIQDADRDEGRGEYEGTGDYLILNFWTEWFVERFDEGTFTFIYDNPDFNESVHSIELRNHATDLTIYSDEETSGSVTIVLTDDIYEVSGTFIIDGKELEVYFKGPLTFVNIFI